MRTLSLPAIAAGIMLSSSIGAAEVAGVQFTDSTEVAGEQLTLNGAGLRKKLWIKVYAAGLYLPEKATSANAVYAMEGPKLVRIQALRDLTKDQLIGAVNDGLEQNLSEAERSALQDRVDRLQNMFGDADEGEELVLRYVPGEGTQVLNDGELVGTIEGDDFYDALLKIWLGDKPADKSLKAALLQG